MNESPSLRVCLNWILLASSADACLSYKIIGLGRCLDTPLRRKEGFHQELQRHNLYSSHLSRSKAAARWTAKASPRSLPPSARRKKGFPQEAPHGDRPSAPRTLTLQGDSAASSVASTFMPHARISKARCGDCPWPRGRAPRGRGRGRGQGRVWARRIH